MLFKQKLKCRICGQEETVKNRAGSLRLLSVDHCHKTGKVRGLLCYQCNLLLGHSRDSVEILENAISYLKESNC